MEGAQALTILSFTRDQLSELAQELSKPDMLLGAEGLDYWFEITVDFAHTLYKEGKINRYPADDHSKVIRYSYNEIKEVFKRQGKAPRNIR